MKNILKNLNPADLYTKDLDHFDFSNQRQEISRNLLLVEDEAPIQNAIYNLLKPMGFEVVIASSGAEALSLFVDSPFSIVVTDFAIMHMNSLILTTHIKNMSPATPVILLVGGESEDDINQLETGRELFYSIIFKPFKMSELQNAIEGAIIYGNR